MPLYEYECRCGHRFSEIKSMNERQVAPCPNCGDWAEHKITPAHFDPRLGLDPDFTTFSDKWARNRERAARGK